MFKLLIIYLLLINILGFIIMCIDKRKAIKKKWRISESSLFFIAIIGGSIGTLAGIYIFRHKTKHKKFTIGMPLILVLQLYLLFYLLEFIK